MARLTLDDARQKMQRGRPWTFRLECRANGRSAFYLCTGRAQNEPVEIHYGTIGTVGHLIVKSWSYIERTVPQKVVKGYDYVDTPFVRVRQTTIDAFVKGQSPVQSKQWRCDAGGVTLRRKDARVEIVFDQFPASWQAPAEYHTFKDDLEAFCEQEAGGAVAVWWGGDDSERFHVWDSGLFDALITWFQSKIPGPSTPLTPPPTLSGPFALVRTVKRQATGSWVALGQVGQVLFTLTAAGARELVTDYPHIQVVGL